MYCVAQPRGFKSPKLFKTKLNGGKLFGVEPDNNFWSNEPMEIKSSEVLVTLGEEPAIGTCYGVYIEPIVRQTTIKGYGQIFIYLKLSEMAEKRYMAAFPQALSLVRKLGPQCDWDFDTEVRSTDGKKWGTYKYKPKAFDTLTLYPGEGQATRELVKVISHELAHGVWFRYMSAEDRADWIELYDKYTQVDEVSVDDLKYMIKDMRQLGSVKDYVKDSEPEEVAAFDMYKFWLAKVHTISIQELNDLLVSGAKIPLPNTHLHKSINSPAITLYSKSNPAELFAEAVSAHCVGDLADNTIIKLLGRLK